MPTPDCARDDARGLRTMASRRTILRAGVATAWAVPVVQLATTAPALAASSKQLTITASIVSWSNSSTNGTFNLQVTVKNTGTVSAVVSTVTLSFPSGWSSSSTTPASGWSRTPGGNSTTHVFTPTSTITLTAGSTTSFTTTINPQTNSVVGTGTYVADGAGLTISGTSSTSGTVVVPTVIDIPGLYPNIVISNGSASWSRSGGNYYLSATATVTNRGRTATGDLDLMGTVDGVGSSTGTATNVATGWTFRTTPDVHYERTGSELTSGQSVSWGSTRQMTGTDAGTTGTLSLTARDNNNGNAIVTGLDINVPASSARVATGKGGQDSVSGKRNASF